MFRVMVSSGRLDPCLRYEPKEGAIKSKLCSPAGLL